MTNVGGRADPGSAHFLSGGGEMGALMRRHDWSGTPFGLPQTWPQSLRSAVSIMLNFRYPIALYWGPQLALLYNDAWSPIPGGKHPWALGRPGREVWPEIWEAIGPLYDKVITTGDARQLRAEQQQVRLKSKRDRASFMAEMASRFEEVVGTVVGRVSSSAKEMHGLAESLLDVAQRTAGEVETAAVATDKTKASIQAVAGGTDPGAPSRALR